MRTIQGDYVERNGQIVFVRWAYLTKQEQEALWQKVKGTAVQSSSAGFC
jgi:hemolysin-activating ACP:hemolysin acyltransferase